MQYNAIITELAREGKTCSCSGSDSPLAGFGPCLIPDRFHLANQATLARGVRLSLAAAGQALACRRLDGPRGFSLERPQCINHLVHALGIICQDGLVCLEPRRALAALGPVSGIGRGLERLGRPARHR